LVSTLRIRQTYRLVTTLTELYNDLDLYDVIQNSVQSDGVIIGCQERERVTEG
jgi:hypothetical protein